MSDTPKRWVLRRRAETFRRIGAALAGVHMLAEAANTALGALQRDITQLREDVAGIRLALKNLDQTASTNTDQIQDLLRLIDGDGDRMLEFTDEDPLSVMARLRAVQQALFAIEADEATSRERLASIRESAVYQQPFLESDPLITVIIPTFDRVELLITRSLPSVLAQTHANLEVIVVADDSPSDVESAVRGMGDDRVRVERLTSRGPYPNSPHDAWYVKGTPPNNAGLWLAKGKWISLFADDDVLLEDALARVLALAQRDRLEYVYGQIVGHLWNGTTEVIGTFPPAYGKQGLQGSLLHSDLRFMQLSLSDSYSRVPNDWSLLYRMMRIGARIGYLPEPVAEWFQTPHPRHADTQTDRSEP